MDIRSFPKTKQEILKIMKAEGSVSVPFLQSSLDISGEGLRKQLVQLHKEGFVASADAKSGDPLGGRPIREYYLTVKGDHLFPKNYDLLTIEVIDTIASDLGNEALIKILKTMTNARIQKWSPHLQGLSVEEKVEALTELYLQEDAFMKIEKKGDMIQLIEHNCPFLNIATKRPTLCSVTVSTLRSLLGYEVNRTETFQNGDRKCVFQIALDRPMSEANKGFRLEDN